jgi:hypothetical protein
MRILLAASCAYGLGPVVLFGFDDAAAGLAR